MAGGASVTTTGCVPSFKTPAPASTVRTSPAADEDILSAQKAMEFHLGGRHWAAKKPRSRTFKSGELAGWLKMQMSSPVWRTARQKASSFGSMCVRALSCWIHIVSPLASRGHFATIAGRTFVISVVFTLLNMFFITGTIKHLLLEVIVQIKASYSIGGIEHASYMEESRKWQSEDDMEIFSIDIGVLIKV